MALGFRSPMYFCLDFGCGGCVWATVLEIELGIQSVGDLCFVIQPLVAIDPLCLWGCPGRALPVYMSQTHCPSPHESLFQEQFSSHHAAERQVEVIQLAQLTVHISCTPDTLHLVFLFSATWQINSMR